MDRLQEVYAQEKEQFFDEIVHHCPDSYVETDGLRDAYNRNDGSVKVEFDGLNIIIIIDAKLWNMNENGSVNGFHSSDSPFSFIKSTSLNETIIHEKNHNLYESLDSHQTVYGDRTVSGIKRLIDSYERMKNLKATPDVLLDNSRSMIFDRVDKVISNLYGEIQADTDRIFNGSINGFWYHLRNAREDLEGLCRKITDDEIKEGLLKKCDELDNRYIALVKDINEFLFISKKTGHEDDLRMCFSLFSDDTRKIRRFLENKVGKEQYFALNQLYNLVDTKDRLILPTESKGINAEERLLKSIFGQQTIFETLSLEGNPENFFSPRSLSKLSSDQNMAEYLTVLKELEKNSLKAFFQEMKTENYTLFYSVLNREIDDWNKSDLEKYLDSLEKVLVSLNEHESFDRFTNSVCEQFIWEKMKQAMSDDDPTMLEQLYPWNVTGFSIDDYLKDQWGEALDSVGLEKFPPRIELFRESKIKQ